MTSKTQERRVPGAARRRGAYRRGSRLAGWGALAAVFALGACDSLLDVNNPNNLTQDQFVDPTSAPSVANGALSAVARSFGYEIVRAATASDELKWIGSRDAWGELDEGQVDNPFNEFTDLGFQFLGEGRWMADEAIKTLGAQQADAPSPEALAQAYLWGAVVYTHIADWLDDFALSDRNVSAPPVGEGNMVQFYQTAVDYIDQGLSLTSNGGLTNRLRAQRARTQHARGVWQVLKGGGGIADFPDNLVSDAGADADASAVLESIGVMTDQRWEFAYSPTTIFNDYGWQVNARLEHRFGDRYIVPAGQVRGSTALMDPIDDIPDPAADAIMTRFELGIPGSGPQYPNIPHVTARELHLILAESALADCFSANAGEGPESRACDDDAGFVTHINHVRAMNSELTPYAGQIPAYDMLKFTRMSSLYLLGRRLADLYRWDERSDGWVDNSTSVLAPGTFFPISQGEASSNECIVNPGSC